MSRRLSAGTAVAVVLVMTMSSGCRHKVDAPRTAVTAPSTSPTVSQSTHEVTSDEVYYLDSPRQGHPPEGRFEAGTRVLVLETMGRYSRVKSEGGIIAWVSSDRLKPLGESPRY